MHKSEGTIAFTVFMFQFIILLIYFFIIITGLCLIFERAPARVKNYIPLIERQIFGLQFFSYFMLY